MKNTLIRNLFSKQRGFTVIEMIVGVAISSIILLGTVVSTHMIFFSGNNLREDMESIQNVQNTGSWLRLDALKSQAIIPGDNPGTGENETLMMYWAGATRKDAQNNDCLDYYEVSYFINNEELRRKEHVTTDVYESDGDYIETIENETTTFVSGNITDISVISDNISFKVSITSLVDDAETQKTYEVFPRAVK